MRRSVSSSGLTGGAPPDGLHVRKSVSFNSSLRSIKNVPSCSDMSQKQKENIWCVVWAYSDYHDLDVISTNRT